MGKLSGLEPEKVFVFFEELCGIPHGSYHIDAISDHLASFARERGLAYEQDAEKNIVIHLDAAPGYETEPVLVLQGHMDMVAVSDDGRDMTKTPLQLAHNGEEIYAEGTSLGGDDGIAVAYMMALADDPSLPHPALDLLITTNEEVGMDGAVGLDPKLLQGTRFLNLDSEDEGIFTVGCAGGARVVASLPLERESGEATADAVFLELTVCGGLGGHSGQMIHKGRANANRLTGRILLELSREAGAQLTGIRGGTAANAIPGEARLSVRISAGQREACERVIARLQEVIAHEYHGKDDGLRLETRQLEGLTEPVYTAESTRQLAGLLIAEPDGVQAMSGVVDGLVETSLNLGIVGLEADRAILHYELRSMIGTAAEHLRDRVVAIAEAFGAKVSVSNAYPEWEYREESPLREKLLRVWRARYGTEPVVEVIHAGLECGVFAKKIAGFDGVSIGPDMRDIHTTQERLSIASAARTWEFLLDVLREKDNEAS